jgi:hypothetical protein
MQIKVIQKDGTLRDPKPGVKKAIEDYLAGKGRNPFTGRTLKEDQEAEDD